MQSLKAIVTLAAAASAAALAGTAQAAQQPPRAAAARPAGYTVATAPDALTRTVLSHALKRIDQGAVPGVDASPVIHRNFPQVIEQNFARLDARSATALLDNLSDKELTHLALRYSTAATDSGRHGSPLLQLLATRVDPARLGRLSKFFGYLPTYEAIVRAAPAKALAFEGHTLRSYAAPGYGQTPMGSLGGWMNFTPMEIYLDFRTAPIGALGVSGALYESSIALGTGIGIAYGVGYGAGTAAAWLMQELAPNLYEAIGGTVSNMVDNLKDAAGQVQKGNLERAISDLFSLDNSMVDSFEAYGGDFEVCEAWAEVANGGNRPPEQDEPI